jgi:hypothetical protein
MVKIDLLGESESFYHVDYSGYSRAFETLRHRHIEYAFRSLLRKIVLRVWRYMDGEINQDGTADTLWVDTGERYSDFGRDAKLGKGYSEEQSKEVDG